MVLKDLRYQDIIIDASNIELKFKAIQNPNIEEDAEGMYHLATSARDVIRTYVETAQDIEGLKLNPKAAKNFLDSIMSRYPQCDGLLETDIFGELADEPANSEVEDEFSDDSDVENDGFIEKGDGTENGPETVGAEPEEPLIDEEPEESEESEESEEPLIEPEDTGES